MAENTTDWINTKLERAHDALDNPVFAYVDAKTTRQVQTAMELADGEIAALRELLRECRRAMIAQGNALNWDGVTPAIATAINKIREVEGELPSGWNHQSFE